MAVRPTTYTERLTAETLPSIVIPPEFTTPDQRGASLSLTSWPSRRLDRVIPRPAFRPDEEWPVFVTLVLASASLSNSFLRFDSTSQISEMNPDRKVPV